MVSTIERNITRSRLTKERVIMKRREVMQRVIGYRLFNYRALAEKTKYRVSKEIQNLMNPTRIDETEKGKQLANVFALSKLCESYGITLSELFKDIEGEVDRELKKANQRHINHTLDD